MNRPPFASNCPVFPRRLACCLLPIVCCHFGGCQQMSLAPPPPLAPPVAAHRPATAAGNAGAAPAVPTTPQEARVQEVAQKLTAANPQIHARPRFIVTHNAAAELSHDKENRIQISEGLVNACGTEGQLAAAISLEMAKWVSERQEQATTLDREANREPPPNVPIGRDALTFGEADQIHKAELAKLGYDRRRPKDPPPPPDPNELARSYLRRAGYAETELKNFKPPVAN